MANAKHEDAVMKMGFDYFRNTILKTLGIDYQYEEIGPTELVELTIQSLYMDFTFLTTGGFYIHTEFQTTDKKEADLRRFHAYDAVYSNKTGKKVITYVIYSGALVTNQWIDDNHYVGEDGSLIPDYQNGVSFRWPLSSGYSYISSYFGNRESPGGVGSTNHKGIDIPAPTGTPIYAAASGTIVAMLSPASSGGAGYYTKINHDGKGLITEYMHQSKFNPNLSVGDKVKKGDIIGYVGSTGNSTGPHLHFGVMVNGVNQNPLNYVKRPS